MKTFKEILKKVGRSDKDNCHGYADWYDVFFTKYRESALNVLEVGVCDFSGGGVISLCNYFEKATIWAVDISRCKCGQDIFEHPRIKFIEQDAYSEKLLENFKGFKFDIIIDDCSHLIDDQLKLFKMLSSYLKLDGIWITEDVCTSHWLPRLNEIWSMNFKHCLIDTTTAKHYDSTLIKFERNNK